MVLYFHIKILMPDNHGSENYTWGDRKVTRSFF